MADTEREYTFGFVDNRRVQANTGTSLSSNANYTSVSTLRARLAAANAGYFTATRLNEMTKNDMVYALRLIDDAAGI